MTDWKRVKFWAEIIARLSAGSMAMAYGGFGIYGIVNGKLNASSLIFLIPMIAAGYFSVTKTPRGNPS